MSLSITSAIIQAIANRYPDRPMHILRPILNREGEDRNSSDPVPSVTGSFLDPFPSDLPKHTLENGEVFLQQAVDLIAQNPASNYFIVPPFLGMKDISDDVKRQHPGERFEQIALKLLVSTLCEGALAGFLLPHGLLLSKRFSRTIEVVMQQCTLKLVISALDAAINALYRMDARLNLGMVFLEKGTSSDNLVRFFKIPSPAEDLTTSIMADFDRLLQQPGGTTNYGYILREGIPDNSILSFDLYNPEHIEKERQIQHYGQVQLLGDLFQPISGINLVGDRQRLVPAEDGKNGILVIDGRNIHKDGTISYNEVRYHIIEPEHEYIRPNDICIRRIVDLWSRLYVALVSSGAPKAVVSNTAILLRPKSNVNPEDLELIIEFLRSEVARQFLRARSVVMGIPTEDMLALPVPYLDKNLRTAVQGLNEASDYFKACQVEAETAKSTLFNFTAAKETRIHVLHVGRRIRQRKDAALLIDDVSYRIRSQMPHPIAHRWRTIETEQVSLETYVHVLECAEVILCYMANFAIASIRRNTDVEIKHLAAIRKRFTEKTNHGITMGDWFAIVREVCTSKRIQRLEDNFPIPELLHCLDDSRVDESLRALIKRRNDQAHGRGPKGMLIHTAFADAKAALQTLLEGVEFLSEYPLLYIEETQRDSIQQTTTYHYRVIMGDHPLTAIREENTRSSEIEACSLYFADRRGNLHLLRPLLHRLQCKECGNWATYHIDTYNVMTEECSLKSLESYEEHKPCFTNMATVLQDVGIVDGSR